MQVFLIREDKRLRCAVPSKHSPHVVAPGQCPDCGETPWKVSGGTPYPSDDDRAYQATAVSLCCRRRAGIIRAEVDTLFGVREDDAVLNGRCRVY
jgi:hypothetical protein